MIARANSTQQKELHKYTTKKTKCFSTTQKIISIIFLAIFSVVILTVICFSWLPHCTNEGFVLPNIVALLISLLIGGSCYLLFKKITMKEKTFKILVILTFSILFLVQLLTLYFSYFKTGWDANLVDSIADQAAKEGAFTTAGSNVYLTNFTNNIFIVSILAFIKSLPVIGGHYFTILAINALLVNLAGLFTCLTLKKLVSKKAGIISIIITAPLLLFSPWIIIPYTDTFSILFPILIFYIYISSNTWWKYGLIFFFSLIGFFIKPTVIITLIAILLIELLKHRPKKPKFDKAFWLRSLAIMNGILFAFLIKYISFSYINYQPVKDITQASYIHFLAMGQNEETCGQFHDTDHQEIKFGTEFEWQKFCNRVSSRSPKGQLGFFMRKLLVNFNDGTFAWGNEGAFYKEVPKRNSPISQFITSFYYNDGENHEVFEQLEQIIWLFVLFGCLFTFSKRAKNEESVLQLSLIGVFLFVMLFEARARYLLCFAPMFVVCAVLGYHKITVIFSEYRNKRIKESQR